jgi:plastocyanin
MRSRLLLVLGVGLSGLLAAAPWEARACDGPFYGGRIYYPAPPRYYSAAPMYFAPRVYYAPPMYQPPYGYPPAYAPGYSSPRPTTAITVGAYDNRFEPLTINVQPGTTVRWVNYGKHVHTVTANDGRWDSGDLPPGGTYSATFQQPGTYYYYCRHHTQEKMQGTIVVGSGGTSGGAAAPGY